MSEGKGKIEYEIGSIIWWVSVSHTDRFCHVAAGTRVSIFFAKKTQELSKAAVAQKPVGVAQNAVGVAQKSVGRFVVLFFASCGQLLSLFAGYSQQPCTAHMSFVYHQHYWIEHNWHVHAFDSLL